MEAFLALLPPARTFGTSPISSPLLVSFDGSQVSLERWSLGLSSSIFLQVAL